MSVFTQIMMKNKNDIPSKYILADYIESHGTEYIDTGISTNNHGFEINTEVMLTQYLNDYGIICGSHELSSPYKRNFIGFHPNEGLIVGLGNGDQVTDKALEINKYYILRCSNIYNEIYFNVNGENYSYHDSTYGSSSSYSTRNLYLFADNNRSSGASQYFKGRIKYIQIYVENNIVGNFIPVYNIDLEEYGMYDKITKQYFGNSGSGSFTGKHSNEINYKYIFQNTSTGKLNFTNNILDSSTYIENDYVNSQLTNLGSDGSASVLGYDPYNKIAAISFSINGTSKRAFLNINSGEISNVENAVDFGSYNEYAYKLSTNASFHTEFTSNGSAGYIYDNNGVLRQYRFTNGRCVIGVGFVDKTNTYMTAFTTPYHTNTWYNVLYLTSINLNTGSIGDDKLIYNKFSTGGNRGFNAQRGILSLGNNDGFVNFVYDYNTYDPTSINASDIHCEDYSGNYRKAGSRTYSNIGGTNYITFEGWISSSDKNIYYSTSSAVSPTGSWVMSGFSWTFDNTTTYIDGAVMAQQGTGQKYVSNITQSGGTSLTLVSRCFQLDYIPPDFPISASWN